MNLIEGLQKEMNRCRELKKEYDNIPTGLFGGALIQSAIDNGEKAIASDDIVVMLCAYEELKGCKG